jgi:hypothetical protein
MSATPGDILPAPTPVEAIRAIEALEQGDWRAARALAAQLGRPGLPVRCLALSMREHALGLVTESWAALAEAATGRPADQWSSLHAGGPGGHVALPWPSPVENDFRRRLDLVGRREEMEARSQWSRIEDSAYPKRACLIEACVDHLTWILFDHSTWCAPQAGEWLPASDRVTQGRLGETGREYFLRRANELLHWINPIQGSLTRKVWDDLGAYRGLHAAALAALADREDAPALPVAQRAAYTRALAFARISPGRPIG